VSGAVSPKFGTGGGGSLMYNQSFKFATGLGSVRRTPTTLRSAGAA